MDGGPSSLIRRTCCRLPPLPGPPAPSSQIDLWHSNSQMSLALGCAPRGPACTASSQRKPAAPGGMAVGGDWGMCQVRSNQSEKEGVGVGQAGSCDQLDTSWTRLGLLSPQGPPVLSDSESHQCTSHQVLTLCADTLFQVAAHPPWHCSPCIRPSCPASLPMIPPT